MNKYDIRLDICTLCNLNCPTCSMRVLNYGKLKAGYLKFDTFKQFIDKEKDKINMIEISNAGEPFLNPDVVQILKYVHENNIKMTCHNASNFNAMTEEKLRAIVDYELVTLAVAIDGVKQENYSRYRRNGDIEKVFKNLEYLLKYKKEKNSNYPYVCWQYVIMDETEDDIELALSKAKELDIPIWFKLTWDKSYVPRNPERIKELTGLEFVTRTEYKEKTGKQYYSSQKCCQLWDYLQINWNGDVLGCFGNREPFNINVFEVGLEEAYYSEQLVKSRKYLLKQIENDQSTPCMLCHNGKKIFAGGGIDPNSIHRK